MMQLLSSNVSYLPTRDYSIKITIGNLHYKRRGVSTSAPCRENDYFIGAPGDNKPDVVKSQ